MRQTALKPVAAFCVSLFLSHIAIAAEPRPAEYSILLRGAHCDQDVKVLTESLSKVPGVKFEVDDVQKGTAPRFFSDPFVVKIADVQKTNIGLLANRLSKASTPHRDEFPVKVNLVLYTSERIDEPSVMALRSALRAVNGLEVDAAGGLGGFPNRGYYWVQLEDAGGAVLSDVIDALEKAGLPVTLKDKS